MKPTTIRSILGSQTILGSPRPLPSPVRFGNPPPNQNSRALDLLLAGCGLLLFSPVICSLPLFIYLEDRGAVLFRQRRCGFRREPFTILKFRTMREGLVTGVGRWLRKTGLDEIAQFFNVIAGQMSIVGPRPLTPEDVTRLGWDKPAKDYRWEVKPGITGLAQVFGGRSARHSLALDRVYLRRKSIRLDLVLIGLSVVINLLGKSRTRSLLKNLRRCFK